MFEKIKDLFRDYLLKNNKKSIAVKKDSLVVNGVFVKSMVGAETDNPIKPYFPVFCKDKLGVQSIENNYSGEGRPFTTKNYEDVFKKHISVKSFLNENKINYLHDMWQDALYLKNLLEPIKKIGLEYTLDLTGGSVRDFVLDMPEKIKDLDFMVSIQGEVNRFFIYRYIQNKKVFTDEELSAVDWPNFIKIEDKDKDKEMVEGPFGQELAKEAEDPMSLGMLKVKLIQLCLNRSKTKIQTFDHTAKRTVSVGQDQYGDNLFRTDRLIGVFKIGSENTNYPIDVLLTDFIKPAFLADFDFDICKASICFVNSYMKKEFPKNNTHLISRFVADRNFWADVHNKTITYDVTSRTEVQINRSFDLHLPRIKEKFPDFKVLIGGFGLNKDYLETKLFAEKLEKDLEKTKTISVKNKLKI